jgi:hypothetical protein
VLDVGRRTKVGEAAASLRCYNLEEFTAGNSGEAIHFSSALRRLCFTEGKYCYLKKSASAVW